MNTIVQTSKSLKNKDDNIHRRSSKNSLKSLKIQKPPIKGIFTPGTLSNSRWQNRKEHPNQSTNNGDIVGKAKRDVSE